MLWSHQLEGWSGGRESFCFGLESFQCQIPVVESHYTCQRLSGLVENQSPVIYSNLALQTEEGKIGTSPLVAMAPKLPARVMARDQRSRNESGRGSISRLSTGESNFEFQNVSPCCILRTPIILKLWENQALLKNGLLRSFSLDAHKAKEKAQFGVVKNGQGWQKANCFKREKRSSCCFTDQPQILKLRLAVYLRIILLEYSIDMSG